MAITDAKIKAFLDAKPWLKAVLAVAMWLLGAAKGRGWFAKRYGID